MARASVKPDAQENRLSDADYEDWDEISSDFGTKIIWGTGKNETRLFVGEYQGTKRVPLGKEVDEQGDPLETATAAEFILAGAIDPPMPDVESDKFYCWLNFALEDAVGKEDLRPGDIVRIEYVGEEETKRGLNPVKKLNIKRKPRPT